MDLYTQVTTLIFSFLYGMFFEFTLHFSSKFIYHNSIIIRALGTFLFVLFHVLFYFYFLQKINYGIVHIYSVICFIVGYIFSYNIKKHLFSRFTFFYKK